MVITEKIKEVIDNEAFIEKLSTIESPEELQGYFKSKGVELSVEEVKELSHQMASMSNEELSEENMENVAGGASISGAWSTGWKLGNKFASWEQNLYKKLGLRW